MFVDFNKVFNEKQQTHITIPQPLVDYMNKSLPKGVKYDVNENGDCIITGSGKEPLSIGGFVFNPTDAQKKVLGENYTQQDVFSYFYNSQKAVPLTLKKEGYIILNGEDFPIEKMSFNLFTLVNVRYVENSFWFYPEKFPEAFPIKIGCKNYERRILISRVPNESVNIMAFESSCEEPLKVQYFINEKKKQITMTLSLNLIEAQTVFDLVQVTSIYNAFIDGEATFSGYPFGSGLVNSSVKKFDDKSIAFWERVLEIEKILGVKFYPPQDDVAVEDIYLVEQLYQSLVNKVPTRDRKKINSLDGKWNVESFGQDINDMIGKPMFFRFECMSHIKLFGINKELPTLVGVANAVIDEYKINGEKQKITFADESQEKERFTSVMFFESEDALLKFLNGNQQETIEMFQNAKKPSEYI